MCVQEHTLGQRFCKYDIYKCEISESKKVGKHSLRSQSKKVWYPSDLGLRRSKSYY